MYSRFLASRSQLNTWLCEIRIACKLNIGATRPEQSVPTRKSVAVLPATFSMSCRKRSPHVFKCCSNAKGMTIGGETLRGVAAQSPTLLGVAAQATFGARAGRPEPVPCLGRFPEGDGPDGGRLIGQVIEPKPICFERSIMNETLNFPRCQPTMLSTRRTTNAQCGSLVGMMSKRCTSKCKTPSPTISRPSRLLTMPANLAHAVSNHEKTPAAMGKRLLEVLT